MPTGISFSNRIEADEYRAKLLRDGKSSKLFVESDGIFRVAITGEVIPTTTDEPFMTETPGEVIDIEEDEEEEKLTTEQEERKKKEKLKSEKGAVKIIGKGLAKTTSGLIERDVVGGFKRQKGTLGGVKAGMIRAIPPRPYTAGGHPRIGAEGAIGLGTPRIGIMSDMPILKNGSIPKGINSRGVYLKTRREKEEK